MCMGEKKKSHVKKNHAKGQINHMEQKVNIKKKSHEKLIMSKLCMKAYK